MRTSGKSGHGVGAGEQGGLGDADMSDHRAASRLSVIVLALIFAGCGSAPSASPVGAVPASPTVGAAPSVTPSATAPSPTPVATPASPSTSPSASPATTPAPTAAPSPVPTASPTTAACPAPQVYVVRAGDNLWDIAKRHEVSVEALLAANPQISDRRVIRVGDEITISPIDLGTLGGTFSRATSINNRGQVVGVSDVATNVQHAVQHAFLWRAGAMTDLGTLGGDSSEAVAINDRGQVVGTSDTASGAQHAFLWENGSMIDLGTLGGVSSEAVAINELGQVVGWSEMASAGDDSPPRHAFLWRAGAMTDLGTLGGDSSEAMAINDRGQVVGTIDRQHAFLWQAGTMTDLGPPGEVYGVAVAINDSGQIAIVGVPGAAVAINEGGQIVGGRYLSDMVFSGDIFLWQNGTTTNLGPLDGAFSWQDGTMTAPGSLGQGFSVPLAVNKRGQVVGLSLTDFAEPNPGEWCCSTLFHAFSWQGGSMIDLGDLGTLASRTHSGATAINDCGQVVGWSARARVPGAEDHAALWYPPKP